MKKTSGLRGGSTGFAKAMKLGRYHLIEQIGEGGTAVVYRAYLPETERQVALKVLHAPLAREAGFIERFRREARILAKLRNPHTVLAYDFDIEEGIYYMVLQYIDGGSLRERLRQAPLDAERAMGIIAQVGNAVDYAHEQGWIHSNLTPSNILLSKEGQAFLADFCAVQVLRPLRPTGISVIRGTPGYMSPEQARGMEVDERSDVYSLGAVLYEMLTGQVVFGRRTPLALIAKRSVEPLPPPRQVNPNISPALEGVILKAMSRTPDDRYPSAGEMVGALQRLLSTPE